MKKREGYHPMYLFKPRIDQNGNKHCLNCDAVLEGRRRRYCSDECRIEFWAKHHWATMRLLMIEESNYTCAKCGFHVDPSKDRFVETHFVVDHIKPIFAGGPEFDKRNLQVLCKKCNKEKTANDIKKYHELRKLEKHLKHVSQYHKIEEFF